MKAKVNKGACQTGNNLWVDQEYNISKVKTVRCVRAMLENNKAEINKKLQSKDQSWAETAK